MHKRDTYLHDDLLAEMAGRLKYGASNIEAKIEQIPEIELKPWVYPTHPMDKLASVYGMRGFEFKALQEAAMAEMPDNALLQEAYRKFMIVAKLVCSDALEGVRAKERVQAIEKAKREDKYEQKVKDREGRIAGMRKSWNDVRDTIHNRWMKLGRSAKKMLERDNTLASMADRDQAFMRELAALGIVAIENGQVGFANWDDRYPIITIDEINNVIQKLDGLESGGFVKKPTKTKLEDILL